LAKKHNCRYKEALENILNLPDDWDEENYPRVIAIVKNALEIPLKDDYEIRKLQEALRIG
jgi:hypothetical protein